MGMKWISTLGDSVAWASGIQAIYQTTHSSNIIILKISLREERGKC